MSQKLKEKLIFITAIVVAILIVITAGITGYIAITDPSSRKGIGATLGFVPVIALIDAEHRLHPNEVWVV